MTARVAVEGGNSVTPPKLTGDAPVEDIVHPVEVVFGKSFGNEGYRAILNRLDCRSGKRLHLNEPLIGGEGLNGSAATVARSYVVVVGLGFDEIPLCLKVADECLTAGISVHTLIFTRVGIHRSIVIHYLNLLKVVTLSYEEVVGVVRGSDLNTARTEADLNVIVGDNGNFPANDGKYQGFSDKMLCIFILRVHCNGSITEHGFRTCSCDFNVTRVAFYGVFDVPEEAGLILIFNLRI